MIPGAELSSSTGGGSVNTRAPGYAFAAIAVAAVLGLLAAVFLPVQRHASAAVQASISGTVTGANGNPMNPAADIDVYAYRFVRGALSPSAAGTGHADASGAFAVTAADGGKLPDGDYELFFADRAHVYADEFFRQYSWNPQPSRIQIAGGQPAAPVTAALAVGGVATGSVTGPGGAPPEAGSAVRVVALDANGSQAPARVDQQGVFLATAMSAPVAADGSYTTPALMPGAYSLRFFDTAGKYLAATAPAVKITESGTARAPRFALSGAGSISGAVVGADGSALDPGVTATVTAVPAEGTRAKSAAVSSDGSFTIGGVATGTWTLAVASTGGIYTPARDAATVNVTSGEAAQLPAPLRLHRLAIVRGTVTGPDGDSLLDSSDIRAQLAGTAGFSRSAPIADDGSYEFTGLPAGDYRLRFVDSTGAYARGSSAISVAVDDVLISDAQLELAASISGTVTGPDGAALDPASSITVTAYGPDGDEAGTSTVNADGSYRISGLAPGPTTLRFTDSSGIYAAAWSGDRIFRLDATPVEIGPGADTIAGTQQLAAGSSITGTLTGLGYTPAGDQQSGIVRAYDNAGDVVASVAVTADGEYTITGLPAGSYRLGFGSATADETWWELGSSLETADPVTVGPAASVTIGTVDLGHGDASPGLVTGLTGESAGEHSIALSWVAPAVSGAGPVIDYTVLFSTDGSTWSRVLKDISADTSLTIKHLRAGVGYRFRVAAQNALGVGEFTGATDPITPVPELETKPAPDPEPSAKAITPTGSCGVRASGSAPSCWLSFG